MELRQLGEHTWYIPGRVNIGYYEENGRGYLIDSGLDDEQGRKILKLLNAERKAPLRAIVNTHSNADHVGANAFIQKRAGCEIWTTRIEGILTERTTLEPLLLWSAWPFKGIRGKFIEAKPSKVTFIDQPMAIGDPRFADEYPIRDTDLIAVPLPGHYLDMIGVKTPDGVFFVADALFDPAVLEKYRFCVMLDVASAHKTLDKIAGTDARWFVPCHAPAAQEIGTLARQNKEGLNWVTEAVDETLSRSEKPLTREEILSRIGVANAMEMDAAHLLLNLSCVSAHLTHLSELGRAEPLVQDCLLVWKRKNVNG